MRARLPLVGLALLLAGVLALAATGAVRDMIVVPLLYMFWVTRLLYESIPQALQWVVFLLVAVLVAAKSLARRPPPPPNPHPATVQAGRVAAWERLLRQSSDDYGRWRLAQRLSAMAMQTLAEREQCSPHELRQGLEDGTLELPDDLRSYLRTGLAFSAPASRLGGSFWQRLVAGYRMSGTTRAAPLDLDPEQVIQFLEQTVQRTIGASR
jgi:hypothetical protein